MPWTLTLPKFRRVVLAVGSVRSDEQSRWVARRMVTNIYVGNLSWTTTDEDLMELFAAHGQVTKAQIVKDRDTGRSRGFGFVEMATHSGRLTP
jgi:RNA recognition motif-containing protein